MACSFQLLETRLCCPLRPLPVSLSWQPGVPDGSNPRLSFVALLEIPTDAPIRNVIRIIGCCCSSVPSVLRCISQDARTLANTLGNPSSHILGTRAAALGEPPNCNNKCTPSV
eukprot:3925124-Lingulodinium_polyedra.AAC.1